MSTNLGSFKKKISRATKHFFVVAVGRRNVSKTAMIFGRCQDVALGPFLVLGCPYAFFKFFCLNAAKDPSSEKQHIVITLLHVFHCEPDKKIL